MKWLAFLLLFATRVFAEEETIPLYSMTHFINGVGSKVTFTIPASRFFEVPTWTPADGAPPLDVVREYQIACGAFQGQVKRPTLNKAEMRSRNRRWWFVLEFNERLPGFAPCSAVVVLMNGMTVLPKVSPEATIFSK